MKKWTDVNKEWGPDQDVVFEARKRAMIHSSVLIHPDYQLPFVILSEASDIGISAVFGHEHLTDNVKVLRPIGFFSRRLKGTELNYSTSVKETLILVEALEHYGIYILGYNVTCRTDQRSVIDTLKQS